MGDHNAVCFMTVGHANLLRRNGAARELVRYRAPLPRGPVKEGLIVDDYDMACVVPRSLRADEPADENKYLDIDPSKSDTLARNIPSLHPRQGVGT